MASLGPWFGVGGGRRGGGWDDQLGGSELWDPFGFGSSRWGQRDDPSSIVNAHVDWRETPNSHIFRADIPGVRKEEVKVHVEDGNILQISGERSKDEEETTDTWHRVERRRGSFTRRFRLPENADLDGINCGLDNGVLTVTVPKKISDQGTSRNVRYIDVV